MIQNEEKVLDTLRILYQNIKQFMENKEYSQAEKCINEGIDLIKDNPTNMFFSSMYKFLCSLHMANMEYTRAIIAAETFLKNKKNATIVDLDFYITIGNSNEELENYEEASKAYNEYLSGYKCYKSGELDRNISIIDNVDSITIYQYNFILLTIANCAFMNGEFKSATYFLQKVDFDFIELELLSPFVNYVFSCGQKKGDFDFVYKLYEKFYELENPNYLYAIINLGEKKLCESPEAMLNYSQSFKDSDLDNQYVRLQKLRFSDMNGEKNRALELYTTLTDEMDMYAYPYNDLLYYGVKYNKDLQIFYERMEFSSIESACIDIALKHEDFCKIIINYVEHNKSKEIDIKTAFMLSLLLQSGLSIANADKDTVKSMFNCFTKTTSMCIEEIFQKSILNDKNCFLLPKGYRFAYYMGKAFREKDKKEIFEDYLFKAKECYPAMEKAIKLLG